MHRHIHKVLVIADKSSAVHTSSLYAKESSVYRRLVCIMEDC
jgi:hypothetical protein